MEYSAWFVYTNIMILLCILHSFLLHESFHCNFMEKRRTSTLLKIAFVFSGSHLTRWRVNDDRMCIFEWKISFRETYQGTSVQEKCCLWNQGFSGYEMLLHKQLDLSFTFSWCFSVSISKKQPLVWANAFPKVLPNSCLAVFSMKNWEELCEVSGYRSRQGKSSCCDRCATQDYGHQSIWITHTCAVRPLHFITDISDNSLRDGKKRVICPQRCCLMCEAIMVIWGVPNAYRPLCSCCVEYLWSLQCCSS